MYLPNKIIKLGRYLYKLRRICIDVTLHIAYENVILGAHTNFVVTKIYVPTYQIPFFFSLSFSSHF